MGILKTSLRGMEHSWERRLYRGKEGQGCDTHAHAHAHTHTHTHTHAHTHTHSDVKSQGWSVWTGNCRLSCRSRQTDSKGSERSDLQTFPAVLPATEVCTLSAASWRHCSPPSKAKHVCHHVCVCVCVCVYMWLIWCFHNNAHTHTYIQSDNPGPAVV